MRDAKKHLYDHAKTYLTLDGISTKLTDEWEIEVDESIVNGKLYGFCDIWNGDL